MTPSLQHRRKQLGPLAEQSNEIFTPILSTHVESKIRLLSVGCKYSQRNASNSAFTLSRHGMQDPNEVLPKCSIQTGHL